MSAWEETYLSMGMKVDKLTPMLDGPIPRDMVRLRHSWEGGYLDLELTQGKALELVTDLLMVFEGIPKEKTRDWISASSVRDKGGLWRTESREQLEQRMREIGREAIAEETRQRMIRETEAGLPKQASTQACAQVETVPGQEPRQYEAPTLTRQEVTI